MRWELETRPHTLHFHTTFYELSIIELPSPRKRQAMDIERDVECSDNAKRDIDLTIRLRIHFVLGMSTATKTVGKFLLSIVPFKDVEDHIASGCSPECKYRMKRVVELFSFMNGTQSLVKNIERYGCGACLFVLPTYVQCFILGLPFTTDNEMVSSCLEHFILSKGDTVDKFRKINELKVEMLQALTDEKCRVDIDEVYTYINPAFFNPVVKDGVITVNMKKQEPDTYIYVTPEGVTTMYTEPSNAPSTHFHIQDYRASIKELLRRQLERDVGE